MLPSQVNHGVLTSGYIPRAALESTGAADGLLQQKNKNQNFRFSNVTPEQGIEWKSLYMTPVKNQQKCCELPLFLF